MSLRATVLHSVLRPGREEAYEAEHRLVPADLLATLSAAGVRDWAIWRDGRDLLHVVDVDDYDDLAARIAADPANLRWQERMAEHVEGFRPVTTVPALERPALVWTLRRQVAEALEEEPG
ncbi:MAG: L-rhamnose mutarotase [Nocardioides alkalitolerans]